MDVVAAGVAGAAGAPERRCSSPSTRPAPIGSAATATPRAATPHLDRLAAGGRPLRPRRVAGAADLAGARQPDDRPQSLRARRAQQRPLRAGRRRADAGRTVHGRGLRHRRLRQLVRARPAVRAGPRLRPLRRRARPAGGRRRLAGARAARRPHRGGGVGLAGGARRRRRRGRTSCGCTSTTPTIPYRAAGAASRPASRAVPTTARSPSRTRWSASCWRAPATAPPPIAAGGRGRRPRREPGRARREHARAVRLRGRPARAADRLVARGARPRASSTRSSAWSTSRRRSPRWPACRAARGRRRTQPRAAHRRRRRRRRRRPAAYAETYFPQFFMGWAPLRSVRDGTLEAHRRARARALRPGRRSRRADQPLRDRAGHGPGAAAAARDDGARRPPTAPARRR